jgi:hypothetical protein
MFGSINLIPVALIGAAVLTVAAYVKGRYDGSDAIAIEFERYKKEQIEAQAKHVEEARAKEQELQGIANKLREEKNREAKKVAALNDDLLNSLRDRKSRSMPDDPEAGQSGCTGKELYREDSEFLVRLAREADEMRIALKQCYSQYDSLTR